MKSRNAGMTILELLIAMTIGLLLLGGAFLVFQDASQTGRTNDEVSRMQENGRFALDAIKADARVAGFWGMLRNTDFVAARAGSAAQLAALGSGDCASRWYIDLDNAVFASNDANPYVATCLPATEYRDGTDILVLRYASPQATASVTSGVVYIRSDRMRGELFVGGSTPAGPFGAAPEDHRLITHLYYVRPYSLAVGDGLPSLRRAVLAGGAGGPVLETEEVVSGIEDLQVQYGIDDDGDGAVNRYIDADTVAPGAEIRALRIWVMARARTREIGFTDAATYTYANRSVTPGDAFRRILLTSTIQLRNRTVVPDL